MSETSGVEYEKQPSLAQQLTGRIDQKFAELGSTPPEAL
jgi:hypothetical protein